MKIGIPRSLVYYYFNDLWINFFNELNIKVVISPETNKEIMDLGIKYSSDEMCLSLKNYIGHVIYLKDKCDYVLVPRIANYGLYNQTCTNFLALYDIINNLDNINIINYNIDYMNKEDELKGFIKIGKELGYSKKEIKNAYIISKVKTNKLKKNKILNNLRNLKSQKKKILLVGHSYNMYDNIIGKPIIKLLNEFNIEIIYSDLFFDKDLSSKYSLGNYFKYSKENISSISKCIDKVNGIIFLTTFPCGIDSIVNELVMRKLDKPYLNLIIDDSNTLTGIETRIESFIDII